MLLFNKVGSRAQARLHQEMSICMGAREVYMYEEGVRHGFGGHVIILGVVCTVNILDFPSSPVVLYLTHGLLEIWRSRPVAAYQEAPAGAMILNTNYAMLCLYFV